MRHGRRLYWQYRNHGSYRSGGSVAWAKRGLLGCLCLCYPAVLTIQRLSLPRLLLATEQLWTNTNPIQQHLSDSIVSISSKQNLSIRFSESNSSDNDTANNTHAPCAINLYGLPRAFLTLVLPSLKKNVIAINPACDYFVHFYNQTNEAAGRSGSGGQLHPEDVFRLAEAVHAVHPQSTVKFVSDTEAEFFVRYDDLLEKIRTFEDPNDPKGHLLYFPWRAGTYSMKTVTNVVKMWHSIETAWNLTNQHALESHRHYERIAMLRSDVMYMNPLHLWHVHPSYVDRRNNSTTSSGIDMQDTATAVIPAFGLAQPSDRMIYGPYEAVREWAARRFVNLDDHARRMVSIEPGHGMHSERFVESTILPNIDRLNYTVWKHDSLCFWRVRVDNSVWISDCTPNPDTNEREAKIKALEQLLGKPCLPRTVERVKGLRANALACGETFVPRNATKTG